MVQHLVIADISGTDLADVIREVKEAAEKARQY
jgi:hypothetical protein